MKPGLELRLYLIRNSKIILFVIMCFIGIVVFVQSLNNMAIEANKEKNESLITNNSVSYTNEIVNNIKENSSNITEKPEKIYEENKEYTKLVKNFISLCENGNVEEAYKMLSQKSYKTYYPTLNAFNNIYFNKMFDGSYNVEIIYEGTNKDIYKIVFKEDALHTGNVYNPKEIINYYKVEEEILGTKIYIIENKEI